MKFSFFIDLDFFKTLFAVLTGIDTFGTGQGYGVSYSSTYSQVIELLVCASFVINNFASIKIRYIAKHTITIMHRKSYIFILPISVMIEFRLMLMVFVHFSIWLEFIFDVKTGITILCKFFDEF